MDTYIRLLLDKKGGLYPYLNRHLPENAGKYDYKILATSTSDKRRESFVIDKQIQVSSLPTSHGVLKSVAWRVDVDQCSMVFMGDTSAKTLAQLAKFSRGVDLLVLSMPLELDAPEPAQALHMIPEDLAQLVSQAKPKKTLLAHFMKRSLKNLQENAEVIDRATEQPVILAEDGLSIPLDHGNRR